MRGERRRVGARVWGGNARVVLLRMFFQVRVPGADETKPFTV